LWSFRTWSLETPKGLNLIFVVFGSSWSFSAYSLEAPIGAEHKKICIRPFWSFCGSIEAKMHSSSNFQHWKLEAEWIFFTLNLLWILRVTCLKVSWKAEAISFAQPFMELLSFKLKGTIKGRAQKFVFSTSNFRCQEFEVE
jgi:hypothetical protein